MQSSVKRLEVPAPSGWLQRQEGGTRNMETVLQICTGIQLSIHVDIYVYMLFLDRHLASC